MTGSTPPGGDPDRAPADPETSEHRSVEELVADGIDPFAHFRRLSNVAGQPGGTAGAWQSMSAAPADAPPTAAADDGPTSWEDLIEDPSWLEEDESANTGADSDAGAAAALSDADRSALWQRFALADVTVGLADTIRSIMGQPTMDFEHQYQAVYPAFEETAARLDHEALRVDGAGPDFAPILEQLRAEVERQRSTISEWHAEHVDRHQRYRQAMVPVRKRMAEDNREAAAERAAISREADEEVLGIFRDIHEDRVSSWEDQRRDWLRNHLR